MTTAEQIEAFSTDLHRLMHRYHAEFEVPVAALIGTLEMAKLGLFMDAVGSVGLGRDDDGEGAEEP